MIEIYDYAYAHSKICRFEVYVKNKKLAEILGNLLGSGVTQEDDAWKIFFCVPDKDRIITRLVILKSIDMALKLLAMGDKQ